MFKSLKSTVVRHAVALHRERSAIAALEYALLASFVAVALIAGLQPFITGMAAFFKNLGAAVAAWAV